MEDQFSVLRQMYADFNARAIDRVLARLHEDVVWPNGWEGGTVTGRDAVRHYWTRQWAAINPVVEPQEFVLLSDRRILVRVHQRVQSLAGDLLSDELISHIYTVDQGSDPRHGDIQPVKSRGEAARRQRPREACRALKKGEALLSAGGEGMLRRVWSCTIDPGRAEAYEEFARLTSLPMFRAQPGFQGCVMARKGTSCDVITLWSDQAAVDALERSESYQATVAAIRASGFVTAEIGTNVATVHLLSLTSTALAAPASEPGADL